MTPLFLGANPAEVRKGPKEGLRILGRREDLAIELMASLDAGQRSKAVIHDKAPWDILGYNASKQPIHDDEGLAAREMNGAQQEMLMTLIAEYVNGVPAAVAQQRLAAIRESGLDDYRLVWAGGLDRSRDHYYRIHGGHFIVEFEQHPKRGEPYPLRVAGRGKRFRPGRSTRPSADVPRIVGLPGMVDRSGWGRE